MNEHKRKRRFIDRQVQGAILKQVLRHWCLFLFGTFFMLTCLQMMFGDPKLTLKQHIWETINQHGPMYLIALCMMPALIKDVIGVSHRFAGPVLRVRRELQRLAKGEHVAPIKLRGNDFWHSLADDFNAALATMQKEKPAAQAVGRGKQEQPAQNPEPELMDCEV